MMNENLILLMKNSETGTIEEIENVWPRRLPEEKVKMNALNSVALRVTSRRWREEKLFPEEVLSGEKPIAEMSKELRECFWDEVENERKRWAFAGAVDEASGSASECVE